MPTSVFSDTPPVCSDELELRCQSPYNTTVEQCVPRMVMCDGHDDCGYGIDEINCVDTNSKSFCGLKESMIGLGPRQGNLRQVSLIRGSA